MPVVITYVMTNYISYTELDFLNLFLKEEYVLYFRSNASFFKILSGVKPRTTASSRKP